MRDRLPGRARGHRGAKAVAVEEPGARGRLLLALQQHDPEAVQQVRNGAIGRLVAHHSTYYTNPVKPMPPESARPAGMSDIEWQIRNWYNFNWLSGDSLVEQAVHNADKIMWFMNDKPPLSAVAVGGRAVPANGGNIYDHFSVNYAFPNGYRVSLTNRQSTGCFNGVFDYVMGTEGTLSSAAGNRESKDPTVRSSGSSRAKKTTCTSANTTCSSRRFATASPRTTTSTWPPARCWPSWGAHAAYTGQQVTWEQALNSNVSLVPKPVEWNGKHEVPGLAQPGRSKEI